MRSGRNGFVSGYSINTDGLRIINLCGPQYSPLHWISLLLSFREFDMFQPSARSAREYINRYYNVDHQGIDCIIGYRADNSCFMFVQDFLDGRLSYQSLRQALTGDPANRQFVLKSNRAFDRISFTGYETALAAEYYPAGASRELRMLSSILSRRESSGLYITQMTEEDIKPYDLRLQ